MRSQYLACVCGGLWGGEERGREAHVILGGEKGAMTLVSWVGFRWGTGKRAGAREKVDRRVEFPVLCPWGRGWAAWVVVWMGWGGWWVLVGPNVQVRGTREPRIVPREQMKGIYQEKPNVLTGWSGCWAPFRECYTPKYMSAVMTPCFHLHTNICLRLPSQYVQPRPFRGLSKTVLYVRAHLQDRQRGKR